MPDDILLKRSVAGFSQYELALLNKRIQQGDLASVTRYQPARSFEMPYLTSGQYYRLRNRSVELSSLSAEAMQLRLRGSLGKLACSHEVLDATPGLLTLAYRPTTNPRATHRNHPSNQRLELTLPLDSPVLDWEQQHLQQTVRRLGGVSAREVFTHPHLVLGVITTTGQADEFLQTVRELPIPARVTLDPLT